MSYFTAFVMINLHLPYGNQSVCYKRIFLYYFDHVFVSLHGLPTLQFALNLSSKTLFMCILGWLRLNLFFYLKKICICQTVLTLNGMQYFTKSNLLIIYPCHILDVGLFFFLPRLL